MLPEQRRKQLDQIVAQMSANKESPESIQMVVNDFKTKYAQQQPQQQVNPLMAIFQRGQLPEGNRSGSNFMSGEGNALSEILFPRGTDVARKQAAGQDVSMDERLGVGGEGIAALLPLLTGGASLPTTLGAAGAIHGATEPGADIGERIKGGATEGAIGFISGKAIEFIPKALNPFKTAGEYRAAKIAEASGKKISGDVFYDDLVKGANNISPTDARAYANYLKQAESLKGRMLSVDDLVQLNQQANKAFTAAGKVGKSAKATFNKVLGDSIKQQLRINAPAVAKANEAFSKMYNTQKFIKKAFPWLTVGYLGNKAIGAVNK